MGAKGWEDDREESEAFQEGWRVSWGRTCLSRLLFLSILQPFLPPHPPDVATALPAAQEPQPPGPCRSLPAEGRAVQDSRGSHTDLSLQQLILISSSKGKVCSLSSLRLLP